MSNHALSHFIVEQVPDALRQGLEWDGEEGGLLGEVARRLLLVGNTMRQLPFRFSCDRILFRSSKVDSKLYLGPGLIVE